MLRKPLIASALILGLGSMLSTAKADWAVVEDWDTDFSVGDEPADPGTHDIWNHNTSQGNGVIVTNPTDSSDQVLKLSPESSVGGSGYYASLGSNALPDDAVSTFYFRAYLDGTQIHTRLSDVDQIGGAWYTQDRTTTTLMADPDPAIAGQPVAGQSWYSIWIVADLINDTYDTYWEAGGNSAGTTVGQSVLGQTFATDVGPSSPNALDSFMLVVGNNHSSNEQSFIGDILVDTAGENLANPIPEPASLALLGLGGLALLARRRTRM